MHGHPVLTEMKWISLQRTSKWLLQTNWKLTIDICDLVYAFEGRNNDVYNLKNVILFSTSLSPILLHLHHVWKKKKQTKKQKLFSSFFSGKFLYKLEFRWNFIDVYLAQYVLALNHKKKSQKKKELPNPNRSVFIVHKAHIDKIDNNLIVSLHSTSLLKIDIWKFVKYLLLQEADIIELDNYGRSPPCVLPVKMVTQKL